jgi:streptogramin lyase
MRAMKIVTKLLSLLLIIASSVAATAAADEAKLKHALSFYAGAQGDGMKQPEDVACGDGTAILVADTGNNRLLRYVLEEGKIKSVSEIRPPEMAAPIRVVTNSQGEIFVLDNRQRILRLNPQGAFQGQLAFEGVPAASSTVMPRALAVGPQDELYVLDVFGARVLVLNRTGAYQRQIDLPADTGEASDIAVDAKGTVLIVDSVRSVILSAAKDDKGFTPLAHSLKDHVPFPLALATDARGMLFLPDRNAGSVVILRRDGSFAGRQLGKGWNEGLLRYPAHLCVSDKGQLFIADRGNNRVQMFTIAY